MRPLLCPRCAPRLTWTHDDTRHGTGVSGVSGRVLVPWDTVGTALAGPGGLPDGSGLTVRGVQRRCRGRGGPGATSCSSRCHTTGRLAWNPSSGWSTSGSSRRSPPATTTAPLLPESATLCNARGLHDAGTAEHALGLILAAQQGTAALDPRAGQRRVAARSTRGPLRQPVVIIGYGSIGAALDARLAACEAATIRVAGRPRPAERVHGVAELDALLPTADVVVLVTRSTRTRAACLTHAASRSSQTVPSWSTSAAALSSTPPRSWRKRRAAGSMRPSTSADPEPLPAGHPLWQVPT